MTNKYYFPFGQELRKVEQKDKTPKKAFVLGVYASAVHARWIDIDGKQKVVALAVASEPEIFWNGDGAEEIIKRINIPQELGQLTNPTDSRLNGPSGRALDKLFLEPLGLTRRNTWLCDLLPESRVNENQYKAIYEHYTPEIITEFNLKPATISHFDKKELNSKKRREEILQELEQSKANKLILLGDLPIKHFLSHFVDVKYKKLSDFGNNEDLYGRYHPLKIEGETYDVLPLVHPRQAGNLGKSSLGWNNLHNQWVDSKLNSNH